MIKLSKNILLISLFAVLLISNIAKAAVVNYENDGFRLLNKTTKDYGNDISIDSDGNIHTLVNTVSGVSILLKHSPTGSLIWAKEYDRSATGIKLNGIEASGTTLYVTGHAVVDGNTDCLTAALDSNGAVLWYQYFGGASNENCNDIVLDNNNNVIVGGAVSSASTVPIIVKYDANGVFLYNTVVVIGIDEYFVNLSVDGDNNIYGLIDTVISIQQRVARLTPDLQRIDFTNTIEFTGIIRPKSIATDTIGNVYVAGNYSVGGETYYLRMVKYDANGNEVCRGDLDGNALNAYSYYDVKVNDTGDSFLTGGGDYSTSNMVTVKYDTNCLEASNVMVFDGGYHDKSRAIALDAAENIYIAGDSVTEIELPFYNPIDRDVAIIKYKLTP